MNELFLGRISWLFFFVEQKLCHKSDAHMFIHTHRLKEQNQLHPTEGKHYKRPWTKQCILLFVLLPAAAHRNADRANSMFTFLLYTYLHSFFLLEGVQVKETIFRKIRLLWHKVTSRSSVGIVVDAIFPWKPSMDVKIRLRLYRETKTVAWLWWTG